MAQDTYANIKGYATSYANQLTNSLGSGIVKPAAADEKLIIFFDIKNVQELIKRGEPDAVYLAGVFGIHDDENGIPELTISLLCADSNLDILQGHVTNQLKGEEVWPNTKLVSDIGAALP